MKPKTPKRAAAGEQPTVTKSAPARRSRAPRNAEPSSTADDRSTPVEAAAPVVEIAAPPELTATIAEQVATSALQGDGAVQSEQIARRAYELFQQDGEVHGRDIDHWLTAERELRLSR